MNRVRVFNKQRELCIIFLILCKFLLKFLDIPEFVKSNEVLKKAWIDKWEKLVTNSFDLSDVYFYREICLSLNNRVFWFQTTLLIMNQSLIN